MSLSKRIHRTASYLGLTALAGASGLLLLAQAGAGGAQPPKDGQTRTVRGVVERFTTAPKGEVDGCALDDRTWIHWPPHRADQVTALLVKGDRIRVTGRDETDKEGRSKFEAASITNLRTARSITLADDEPDARPKGPKGKKGKGRRGRRGEVTVLRGTVERFTTAPKGEVDGFKMDDGTWIHWPPHLADQTTGVFRKGDRVRVTGSLETGKRGETKFEARSIVNLRTEKSVVFDEGPDAANREERLRALERRLADLLREIKQARAQR